MMSAPHPKYSFPWLAERFDSDTTIRIWREMQASKGIHSEIVVEGGALIERWPSAPKKTNKKSNGVLPLDVKTSDAKKNKKNKKTEN